MIELRFKNCIADATDERTDSEGLGTMTTSIIAVYFANINKMTTSAAASQVQHPFMVSGPTIVKWINCCLLKVVKKTPIFLEFDPLAFVSCYTRYIDLAGVFSLV